MRKAFILALLLLGANGSVITAAEKNSSDVNRATETTSSTIVEKNNEASKEHTSSRSNNQTEDVQKISGKLAFHTKKVPDRVRLSIRFNGKTKVVYATKENHFKYDVTLPKAAAYTVSIDPQLKETYRIQQSGANFSLSLIPTEKLTYTIKVDDGGTHLIPKNLRLTLFDDGVKLPLLPKVTSDFKTGTFTYTFTVLKDGSHYTATPKMDNEKQYTLTKGTNTFTYKAKTTILKGKVQFIDGIKNNRPSEVVVNVMNNHQIVDLCTAKASANWNFTSKALPLCDALGNNYHYTVKGTKLLFYQQPVTQGTTVVYRSMLFPVAVEKVDATTKQPLQGGIIKFVNTANNEVVLPINGTLPVGQTYQAVTVMAPLGYKKANPVTFRILEDGSLQVKGKQGFVPANKVTIPYQKATLISGSQGENPSSGTGLPDFQFPDLGGAHLDLPKLELPKLDLPKLDLPSLNGGTSGFSFPKLDLPNLSHSSGDIPSNKKADQSPSEDTKSNGGLGNFSDLFSFGDDKKDNLPQTGNKKTPVLTIIGTAIVIIVIGVGIYFFVKKNKKN